MGKGEIMKLLILCLFAMTLSFAQTRYEQLTNPQYLNDLPTSTYDPDNLPNSSSHVKLNNEFCRREQELRTQLPSATGAQREALLKEILKNMKACSVNVIVDGDEINGFSFTNESENAINPRTAEFGSNREFNFRFDQRNKQDMHLHITEDSGLTGRMSHDLLETMIVFVPRRVVPYIDMNTDQVNCGIKIVLPTDEYILFDAITKEIIGGVLEEQPMDMTESRHHREFAGLNYTGNGIMIRADRRAGTPEHTYNVSYNVNERVRDAVVIHKGKECIVNKNMIWENTEDPDETAYFMYSSDQEFLDTVINPICGWNLTMDDII